MPTVTLEKLTKNYGKITALRDINLQIPDGSFSVIVGPSGCGKSTLLKVIAGLEKMNAGKIFFNEEDVSFKEPQERNVSMVFQDYMLFPHLTVFQNLEFPLKVCREKKSLRREKVMSLANELGIVELLDRHPDQLSGGQRQRVALGRALIRDPQVFLFDEPLSSLDAQLRIKIRELILNLQKKIQKTFIYVTHDQMEALCLASQLIVMNAGGIVQIGTPEEIFTAPKNLFVAQFIGHSQLNFFREYQCESGNYILCIRPEKCQMARQDSHLGAQKFIDGVVIHSEFQGDYYLIRVKTKFGELMVKNDYSIMVNQSVPVSFYIRDIMVFQKETQCRLSRNNEMKIADAYFEI